MLDYEKLGAFYLGKRVDQQTQDLSDDLVLYDSKDLTTHAVIIGMTGSGKTGLGIGLLEEAAMDNIPVIAIDPKGDLGNLLLTFPDLAPADFQPWINRRAAADQGQTEAEYAADQAALWKKGLAEWGQDGARIRRMRENVELSIYTPGSTAGLPVSVLASFNAPPQELIDDADLYGDRVQATATSVLSLLKIDADPVSSRDHILISRLLDHAWREGRNVGIAELIAAIQNPPLQKVGVMDVDSFYPPKQRFDLAMKLNNLLAAPGFDAWTNGEPLNARTLLYTETGKPRISVMSIAHLNDAERMFFVSMLLNEIIAWMRAQPGTSSLRAILYMDEIFGYMPPVANPPSKNLLLTMLKQARAYGLGLALATQNPVDLDYRGLSNTGTWMIGRLQTERDKARVMEGLEGASQHGNFDKQAMEQTLAGLGKRRFLLHNVHEEQAVVFNTRWAMSYLAGPLTRDQIKKLAAPAKSAVTEAVPAATKHAPEAIKSPVLPPTIKQFYIAGEGEELMYFPRLLALTNVAFTNARYKVNEQREVMYSVEFEDGPVTVDWGDAERLPISDRDLESEPTGGAGYAKCPGFVSDPKNFVKWEKDLKRWIRQNETISLYRSKTYRTMSEPGEAEGEFRSRLQHFANEQRDAEAAKLRKRYASRAKTLQNRLLRAEQAIQREQEQSSSHKMDAAISFGTAILSAVLGRKTISSTTAGKMGTAMRKAGSAKKQAGDVARAQQTADQVRADLAALNQQAATELAQLSTKYNAQNEDLSEIAVRPKSADIHVPVIGLGWMPYARNKQGRYEQAWIN